MRKKYSGIMVLVLISTIFFSCTSNDPVDDHGLAGMPFKTLSEYNFFVGNMADLNPSAALIPYDLTTPLFTDYAQKARFIFVPEGETVPYNDIDYLEFPVGSILIKNFYYADDLRQPEQGRKIIETRLLIHFPDGWDANTYLWNEEQTEANYSVIGKHEPVSYINEKGVERMVNYVVPNKNDCKGCHNLNNKFSPIGPKARYLNRTYNYPDGEANILNKLVTEGILVDMPALDMVPKGVVWNDANSGSLEERARTYLDINCGHCHRPEGPANHSGLFLYKHETDPLKLGFCKRPVAAGGGSGGLDFDIMPGTADNSIVHFRMSSEEPGTMMPELGRTVTHQEGVELVSNWINSLEPAGCN